MQTPDLVSVEDSSGTVLEEIVLPGGDRDKMLSSPGARNFDGTWAADSLRIEHDAPNGAKVTEAIALLDQGESMMVRTKVLRGKEPPREFKRVYQRVAEQ